MTLTVLAQVMRELGEDAKRVQVLFITVGPERDSAQLLARYVPAFNPAFLGLRGSAEETAHAAERFDVDYYTKLELAIRGIWRRDYSAKLTIKPVVDWEQDTKTSAVLELEGGWTFIQHWRALLMVGTRLWRPGVPRTYGDRVELTVAYAYL